MQKKSTTHNLYVLSDSHRCRKCNAKQVWAYVHPHGGEWKGCFEKNNIGIAPDFHFVDNWSECKDDTKMKSCGITLEIVCLSVISRACCVYIFNNNMFVCRNHQQTSYDISRMNIQHIINLICFN